MQEKCKFRASKNNKVMVTPTTKLYLDARALYTDGTAPLKISIRFQQKVAMLFTGIRLYPEHWDAKNTRVVGRYDANSINAQINWYQSQIDTMFAQLSITGDIFKFNVAGLRDLAATKLTGQPPKSAEKKLFASRFERFIETKNEGTREVYQLTLNRLRAYDEKLDTRTFEDINVDYIRDFEQFLKPTNAQNSRNIHLRNIRAVFNDAIDAEITSAYPFRRIKLRYEKTRKRALTIDALREFWNFVPEEPARKYHDIFKLSFLLIGINLTDLHGLTRLENGRIEYVRAKTHRPYSIKVEPEAMQLIRMYQGKNHLLIWGDKYKNSDDLLRRTNRMLRKIGDVKVGKQGVKEYTPLQPEISTYWARHTWATIAASLDIPRDTIAHALGHGNNTITDIYIDFDMRKVDEANRRVIDWVLYGKK
jgi:site-specific recombinase XerD